MDINLINLLEEEGLDYTKEYIRQCYEARLLRIGMLISIFSIVSWVAILTQ